LAVPSVKMIDITLLVMLISLVPIVFSLAGTAIFLRYPDKHLSVVIFSLGLASLMGLLDLFTDFTIVDKGTFRDLSGNMFQASAAMLGILGAFWVYYIDAIKNRIIRARREIIRLIPNMPLNKMYVSDEEFMDYLGSLRVADRKSALYHSVRNLAPLVRELESVTLITSNLISFLFMTMLLGLMSLLFSDSLNFASGIIKLLAYFVLSFGAASFASGIYGVYRIIYPAAEMGRGFSRQYTVSGRM
jgi:hypothetical protein